MPPSIHQSLKALFASFPAPDSGDSSGAAMAYLMAIDGEPQAAVAEAVQRFIRGEVKRERHTFMPSAAEFAIEVRARSEMARIKAKLQGGGVRKLPKPLPDRGAGMAISEAERAQVGRMMADLSERLSGKVSEVAS